MVRIEYRGVTYYIDDTVYDGYKYINVKDISQIRQYLYTLSDIVIEDNKLLKCRYWKNLSEFIEIGFGSIHKVQLDVIEDKPVFTELSSEERKKT